jgi:hypothetical protein
MKTKIVYMLALFPLLHKGLKSCFYQSTWGHPLVRLQKARLALQVKNSFVLPVVQSSFVLLMWVHRAYFVNVKNPIVIPNNLCNGLI